MSFFELIWNLNWKEKEVSKTYFKQSLSIKASRALCNSMDGTGEHYAKWSKPGGEGQIPYDLTFNWNLINKTKSKQNVTRDIEIKNSLAVTRGEVGGDNEGKGGRFVKKHV